MSQFYKKLCGNRCSSAKKNLQRIKGEEAAEKDMEPTVYNTISKYILIKIIFIFLTFKCVRRDGEGGDIEKVRLNLEFLLLCLEWINIIIV